MNWSNNGNRNRLRLSQITTDLFADLSQQKRKNWWLHSFWLNSKCARSLTRSHSNQTRNWLNGNFFAHFINNNTICVLCYFFRTSQPASICVMKFFGFFSHENHIRSLSQPAHISNSCRELLNHINFFILLASLFFLYYTSSMSVASWFTRWITAK